jgi:hypothetical protein
MQQTETLKKPQAARADSETAIESLKEEMTSILEECRMVLPGMQALFGFQTIAVFNQRFQELPPAAANAHLLSLFLVAVAIALNMAPAAYHRIAEPGRVSRQMVKRASAVICIAMMTLMLGFALEMYVVFELGTGQRLFSVAVALFLLLFIGAAWFALPYLARQRLRRKSG